MSAPEQRRHWHQRAAWLAQLGLVDDEPAPVEAIEEVANACLTLLDEVRRLELDRAEARAWAWGDWHRYYHYSWVNVAGGTYNGDPDTLPPWMTDARQPPQQEWWPEHAQRPEEGG